MLHSQYLSIIILFSCSVWLKSVIMSQSDLDLRGGKIDAVSLMKDSLPEYVVNCFLAAGYDVTEVIVAMDVSENPGNSIESIENYISDRYPKDPRYSNNPDCDTTFSPKPFEFPPGHKIHIRNFILELRKKMQSADHKATTSSDKGNGCKRKHIS